MSEDRFLSRWSRRKAKARPTRSAPEAVVVSAPDATVAEEPEAVLEVDVVAASSDAELAVVDPVPEEELSDEELAAKAEELGLPPLESLGEGSDYTGFMSGDVPERLRTLALRRLWRSNPILANVDGLVDYGEDFTDAALVVKNMQTAYQVGTGYAKPEIEPELEPESDDALEVASDDGCEEERPDETLDQSPEGSSGDDPGKDSDGATDENPRESSGENDAEKRLKDNDVEALAVRSDGVLEAVRPPENAVLRNNPKSSA